jgi:hypothetical protein
MNAKQRSNGMKNVLTVCLAAMLLMAASGVAQDTEEKPWFDMEKCGFCKHLLEDPEMLDHCTWEHHNLEDGMMSVSTVEKEYLPSYREAMAKMQEVGEKMEQGEMVPMCGMCTAMGELMQKGAEWEYVQTEHGDIMIMTSDDPEVIAELHAFSDKTNAELEKMMAASTAEE